MRGSTYQHNLLMDCTQYYIIILIALHRDLDQKQYGQICMRAKASPKNRASQKETVTVLGDSLTKD